MSSLQPLHLTKPVASLLSALTTNQKCFHIGDFPFKCSASINLPEDKFAFTSAGSIAKLSPSHLFVVFSFLVFSLQNISHHPT